LQSSKEVGEGFANWFFLWGSSEETWDSQDITAEKSKRCGGGGGNSNWTPRMWRHAQADVEIQAQKGPKTY